MYLNTNIDCTWIKFKNGLSALSAHLEKQLSNSVNRQFHCLSHASQKEGVVGGARREELEDDYCEDVEELAFGFARE